jgi:exodeoxyribonuclease VII large subunit
MFQLGFGGTMSEQADLFSARNPKPEAPEPSAWTVSQFNERVKSLVKGAFGSFRIQGFVSGFARSYSRGGHVYFELQERESAEAAQAEAVINLIMWRGVRGKLESAIRELGGDLDDMQVYFQVSPDLYVRSGRLSLIIEDIDVEASLGAQKLDRERLLRKLAAEGLLEKNRQLPLPLVPLRVGLVTSVESAAYHDFTKELGLYGLAFKIFTLDARVQGAEAESTVPAALDEFGRRAGSLDVIVLIRGGGSRSDLAAFDSEPIARAIAASPLPVLTGIGHEIDRSVADELSHRAFKTPTATAQFLTERVESYLNDINERGREIRLLAEGLLREERAELDERGHRFQRLVERGLSRLREGLSRRSTLLPRLSRAVLERAGLHLGARQARIAPRRILGDLSRRGKSLEDRRQALHRNSARNLNEAARSIAHRADRLKLLDPVRVLERGFSITYGPGGKALRSARDAKPGTIIQTRLAKGRIESETIKTETEDEA